MLVESVSVKEHSHCQCSAQDFWSGGWVSAALRGVVYF